MSMTYGECERCLKRVRQSGDHLCVGCASELGRDVKAPWWGDFRNHPDARLRPSPSEASRARDFVGFIDRLAG